MLGSSKSSWPPDDGKLPVSELCFTPRDEELLECFDQGVTGDAFVNADGCLALGDGGEVIWSFTPVACDHPDSSSLVADSITLQVA